LKSPPLRIYKIVYVTFHDGKLTGTPENFLTGLMPQENPTWIMTVQWGALNRKRQLARCRRHSSHPIASDFWTG
jgi:hypothetical protein